ncbi:hypothetical protein PanWU01x14_061410 [Parasponia andersonii]|uniref:Keratin-associated protein n=1 Tax=Parasponia andersonii TaxID=3476 RepID=A0A2P5DI80_PARAD|nr:hypothetical protein PanWU01x14_061410 [Parasponia andersonii]
MAFSALQLSLGVITFGVISFILGIVAENKKLQSGTPIKGRGAVICTYPSDPAIPLGYLSFAFLVASTVVGYLALFYPYKGKSIPHSVFFKSRTFFVFFNITLFTAGLGAALTLWPTIEEQHYLKNKVYPIGTDECPIGKVGLLGGGAFLSLDSSLLWLVALMLASNVRDDYFDEVDGETHLVEAAVSANI